MLPPGAILLYPWEFFDVLFYGEQIVKPQKGIVYLILMKNEVEKSNQVTELEIWDRQLSHQEVLLTAVA